MRQISTQLSLAILVALSLAGCGPKENQPAENKSAVVTTPTKPMAQAVELNRMYGEFWEETLKLNPVQATFVGDARYNDQLPDFGTAEFREKNHAFTMAWLEKFNALDPNGLDGQARLSYDIFVADLNEAIEGEKFPDWMMPINQFGSIATFAPVLGSGQSAQPFKTVKDYDNWLARGNLLGGLFDTSIANMRVGMEKGVLQPKVLMKKVLPQLTDVIKDKPEDSLFWMPITNMPKDFPEADRVRLTEAYRKMIGDGVMPAYRRLNEFIEKEYLPACRDSVSWSALPDGQAWYAYLVKQQTTTDLSPAEIHDIGLKEVARIQAQMREVMKEVKFEGELQDFFKYVTTDEKFEFKTEADLLKAYNDLRERVDAGVPNLFSLTPKAGFEIRPVEPFRAASSSGGSYQGPSQDGTRPGIFYVNTYDLLTRKTWDAESLYLHEAIPGHHFQIALQQELGELPMFRRFGGETSYAEGWGLYSESLGKELGVYTDPYQYFGRLQAELWRAIRLVVDTGLHSKDWTREQVIQYMKDNSATSDTEAVSEAERYIAIAGQALAYKIGELKILELRKRAQDQLGDKFDPREFHAEILRDGSLPLGVLEAKMDRWLASIQTQTAKP